MGRLQVAQPPRSVVGHHAGGEGEDGGACSGTQVPDKRHARQLQPGLAEGSALAPVRVDSFMSFSSIAPLNATRMGWLRTELRRCLPLIDSSTYTLSATDRSTWYLYGPTCFGLGNGGRRHGCVRKDIHV